jgi:thiol-disulfide isomerase/thioredoxin
MSSRQEKERRRQARDAAQRAEPQRASRRRDLTTIATIVATIAAVALALVLVVSHRNGSDTATAPAAAAPAVETRGVPPQIAANAKQANRIVDGSIKDKLAQLRGVPVVVNQWASWCPNCQQEFPFFQRLADTLGRRVAFVGLDSQDARADAQSFLRSFPVSYPSIYDPSADQARSIGGGHGWPTTFYYDRTGRQTYVREGGYTSLALLAADVRRYALGEGDA